MVRLFSAFLVVLCTKPGIVGVLVRIENWDYHPPITHSTWDLYPVVGRVK